jgi:putative addiction module component (TIGR02574 family)
MSTTDEILAAFNALPPSDKWSLLNRVWDQFPPEAWPTPDATEIALLDARFAELDSGAVESIPIAEARRQMREHLNRYE